MNKKVLLSTSLLVAGTMMFTGCGPKKVAMQILKPAEVPALVTRTNVAVSDFKGDDVKLATKIEGELANVVVDGKKYFKVANRSQMKKILAEQKFQASDLADSSNAAKIGKLLGAQAIVGGEVTSGKSESTYKETRQRCAVPTKKGCARYENYQVTCYTANADLTASVNVVDVETAENLHTTNATNNYSADSCKDSMWGDTKKPSAQAGLNKLVDQVAKDFRNKVAPRYETIHVALIEKVKSVELNEKQTKNLENALKFIEQKRNDKAKKMLSKLNDEVNEESYEILYNLGLLEQANGKYDAAKALFTAADEKAPEPDEILNAAIVEIDNIIADQKKAKEQLAAKK